MTKFQGLSILLAAIFLAFVAGALFESNRDSAPFRGTSHLELGGEDLSQAPSNLKDQSEAVGERASAADTYVGSPANDGLKASTFKEAISLLSPEEKEYVRAFNDSVFGALNFDSEQQREWKASRGYPSVVDVLRAARLTDQELEDWALTGDTVGAQLHFKRLSDQLASMEETLGVTPGNRAQFYETNAAYSELADRVRTASTALDSTGSPFAAYLLAELQARNYSEPFPYSRIASAAIAGDRNALQQIERVRTSLQPMIATTDQGLAIQAYDAAAVDSVLSFLYGGILAAQVDTQRGLVCP